MRKLTFIAVCHSGKFQTPFLEDFMKFFVETLRSGTKINLKEKIEGLPDTDAKGKIVIDHS
jgi:hypothetical protein